jgi:hypothetical protein
VGKGSAEGGGCSLLLFPRHHLDFSSLLLAHPLGQQPVAMDCAGSHILLASEPLELALLEVQVTGDVTPLDRPRARVSLARELSIASFGRPLRAIALVPGAAAAAGGGGASNGLSHSGAAGAGGRPRQCVLLRWGGLMSVLDMERGSELQLSRDVESFWLSETLPVAPVVAPPPGPSRAPSSVHLDHEALGRLGITDNSAEASTTGARRTLRPPAAPARCLPAAPGLVLPAPARCTSPPPPQRPPRPAPRRPRRLQARSTRWWRCPGGLTAPGACSSGSPRCCSAAARGGRACCPARRRPPPPPPPPAPTSSWSSTRRCTRSASRWRTPP